MKHEYVFIAPLKRNISFIIGQCQSDNFAVIDAAAPDDLWFHAGGNEPSCHVIAQIPGDIDKKDLRYIVKAGAVLCRQYTNRLKSAQNVEFIYTQTQNITKTNIPGRVIAEKVKSIRL
jgi:predicted ribosome quality control (RQC) complex YloA/Tae2 family protein